MLAAAVPPLACGERIPPSKVGHSRSRRARRPNAHLRRHATLGSRAAGTLPVETGRGGRGKWRYLRARLRRPDGYDKGAQREVPFQAEDARGIQVRLQIVDLCTKVMMSYVQAVKYGFGMGVNIQSQP